METEAELRREVANAEELEGRLRNALIATTVYLLLVGGGSIVAVLLLLGPTKDSDLARVAALALCGGAIGGTVRGLMAVMEAVSRGVWELSDGTIVRREERRVERARQMYLDRRRWSGQSQDALNGESESFEGDGDDDRTPHEHLSREDRAALVAQEAERKALSLTKVEYVELKKAEQNAERTWGFGIQDIPWLVLHPLLGAALGLIAFAGLVGGFLVASGQNAPTSYSPAGLIFVAVLAGMFSPNFVASLARAADAIFGKTQPQRRLTSADEHKES